MPVCAAHQRYVHCRHSTQSSPTRAAPHKNSGVAVPLKGQTDRRPTKMIKPYFMCKPYLFTRFSFARLYCSPTNGMSAMKKNRRPPHWDLFRSVSDQFFSCQNSSGNWLPSSLNTQPAAAAAAIAAVQLQGKNGVVLLSGKV